MRTIILALLLVECNSSSIPETDASIQDASNDMVFDAVSIDATQDALPCGLKDQRCCANYTCSESYLSCQYQYINQGGYCDCGVFGFACCSGVPAEEECDFGSICTSGICGGCGTVGEVCCPGNRCFAPGSCSAGCSRGICKAC